MQKIKGLLFDFDGVILDTDNSYRKLVSDLLTNEFSYEISLKDCIERWKGKNADQIARELVFEGCSFADEFAVRANKLSDGYIVADADIVKNIKPLLKSTNLPKAICSNGRTSRILNNLKQTGLESNFQHVLGRDKLGVMKPDPQVYIKGAEKLGLEIENCLVIEDSATGLQAGIEAGAMTVGFTGTGVPKEKLEKLHPNFIVSDLEEVIEIIKTYS